MSMYNYFPDFLDPLAASGGFFPPYGGFDPFAPMPPQPFYAPGEPRSPYLSFI